MRVLFFPANKTSVLQPLDKAIIAAMKMQHRRRLLQSLIAKVTQGTADASELSRAVTPLMAIYWVRDAVAKVKGETVEKCFVRSGFPATSEEPSADWTADDDIPLATLVQKATTALRLPKPVIAEEYAAGSAAWWRTSCLLLQLATQQPRLATRRRRGAWSHPAT